jgi:type II secretory pathway component PulF
MNGHFHIFAHVFCLIIGLLFALSPNKWLRKYSDKRRMMLRIIGALFALIYLVQIAEDLKILNL